jgi:hypothetical protein
MTMRRHVSEDGAYQFQCFLPSSLLMHPLDNLQLLHSPFDSLIRKARKENDAD